MAEEFAFNIAGGIISGVVSPLVLEKVKLFWGAKEELEKLAFTVSLIRAGLLDAEKRRPKEGAIRLWLEMLSNVLYEADDLLDAVFTEAQRRKIKIHGKAERVRKFISKSNEFAFRIKMVHKIKAIREKLDSIADNMKFFEFTLHYQEPQITDTGRGSTSFVKEKEVIGRESHKKEVIKMLLDTNVERNVSMPKAERKETNVSVLPIIGIGGIGKTTLAQYIYNDKEIQLHFHQRIWICVSDAFIVKNIVERIPESITNTKSKSLQENISVKDGKEMKENERFLLVLDDVWNEDAKNWSDLKLRLMDGGPGSKILVTARSEGVAKSVAKIMPTRDPYRLEGLEEHKSLELLVQMAFPDGKWPSNPRIEDLGRQIVRKYAHVPLAVKTVGKMLHMKNSEKDWLNVVNNELPSIENDKYGILLALELSYNKLPSYLRRCFTYCSIYPKAHEYDKTTIIHEWIAHGFVDSENQCLQDIGNNYFEDLLWRSFFQDPIENDEHVVIRCKIHDLMHDLATSIMARSLVIIVDEKKWKVNKKTRHLSICEGLEFSIKELISQCEGKMIRTFHCPNFGCKIDCEAIFSSLKFLRVLNLSRNNLKHVPYTIGKLKHLRYLNLSWNTEIKKLPCSCTKLVNLQFLNLSYCKALEGLPRGIKNLINLRDLNLDGCGKMTYFPHGLRKSTSLQWLKQFWIDLDSLSSPFASLGELKELNELGGRLKIWNLRLSIDVESEYKAANIKEITGLKSLILHFSSNDEVQDNDVKDERLLEGLQPHKELMELVMDSCRSVRLPNWIFSITGLVELRLYKCRRCQNLLCLNQMRSLKVLDLREMDALEYIFNDFREMDALEYEFGDSGSEFSSSSSIFFPSLSKMHFDKCPKLKGWWKVSSLKADRDNRCFSFPALSYLDISRCQELDLVGDEHGMCWNGLKSLTGLVELRLYKCCRCQYLPCVNQMRSLRVLDLRKMDALEYIFDDFREMDASEYEFDDSGSEFSSSSSIFFPSLSKIHFDKCPKLKGWWKDSSLKAHHDNRYFSFPALSYLDISRCPELDLVGDEHGMCWNGLKSLISLRLSSLPKLISLPWELQHVSTIQNVSISYCKNLKTVLESILHWKSFQVLQIQECPRLTELPAGIEGPAFQLKFIPAGNRSWFERYDKDESTDWHEITDISESSTE